mmetsp:Transcript_14664/g.30114  ORF Transcript_14664/g.30114 Transcript_14664/m.30114 type:complete len:252 (-) Transcript_14664:2653-3408(-)
MVKIPDLAILAVALEPNGIVTLVIGEIFRFGYNAVLVVPDSKAGWNCVFDPVICVQCRTPGAITVVRAELIVHPTSIGNDSKQPGGGLLAVKVVEFPDLVTEGFGLPSILVTHNVVLGLLRLDMFLGGGDVLLILNIQSPPAATLFPLLTMMSCFSPVADCLLLLHLDVELIRSVHVRVRLVVVIAVIIRSGNAAFFVLVSQVMDGMEELGKDPVVIPLIVTLSTRWAKHSSGRGLHLSARSDLSARTTLR